MKKIFTVDVDERDPVNLEVGFWCADCFINCDVTEIILPTDAEIREHFTSDVNIRSERMQTAAKIEGANWMKGKLI